MNDYPLVSIAAINYNNSEYVIETLESIRNQTYPNIELVIVDDCSTDNSVAIIDLWLNAYKGKYKFIKHEVNKGVCIACNSGLNNASGQYFSIIATDDLVVPEKIATQVKILEATDIKVAGVYSDAYVIDATGKLSDGFFIQMHRQFSEIPSGNIYETLLQGNYIPGMTFLFKKFVFADVGGYDESLVYEDYDMWLRIASKYEILYSDHVSVKYRIRPGSLTQSIKNWKLSDAKIFSKHATAPLPIQRIRQIAYDAYLTNDHATMPYIKDIADKNGDLYILAAWLLWRFGFPIDDGEYILDKVLEGFTAGSSKRILSVDNSDSGLFINNLDPIIPDELIKKIAFNSYAENNEKLIFLVRELAKNKKDVNFRAIWLLWKFKIRVPVGEIIAARIDTYCKEGRNKLYISLCIYKDIFEALIRYNSVSG